MKRTPLRTIDRTKATKRLLRRLVDLGVEVEVKKAA
jgi:hypothetical protein